MKHSYLKLFGLTTFLAVSFSLSSSSQERARTVPASISAEDKRTLITMFKGVDPKLYRLQFNGGREVYGARKVTMAEITQVRKVRNPLDEKGWIFVSAEEEGVMFWLAVASKTKGSTDLASVLSKESMKKLKDIIMKYSPELNVR